jgi:hypothetical protein
MRTIADATPAGKPNRASDMRMVIERVPCACAAPLPRDLLRRRRRCAPNEIGDLGVHFLQGLLVRVQHVA